MFGPKICYPVCYHFTKLVCYVRHSRVSEYQILRALVYIFYKRLISNGNKDYTWYTL